MEKEKIDKKIDNILAWAGTPSMSAKSKLEIVIVLLERFHQDDPNQNLKISLSIEQTEDVLELLRQHEELCHETSHGTLILEQIDLREYLTKKMKE